jgi:hypothetical protein
MPTPREKVVSFVYRGYPPMTALTHAAGRGLESAVQSALAVCEANGSGGTFVGAGNQARRSACTGVNYPARLSTREGV